MKYSNSIPFIRRSITFEWSIIRNQRLIYHWKTLHSKWINTFDKVDVLIKLCICLRRNIDIFFSLGNTAGELPFLTARLVQ